MAYNGVGGWHYGGIADYYGKNLAVPECGRCQYLLAKEGTTGTFGFFKYKCNADTGCAASKMGQGKMMSSCPSFKEVKSGGGGGGIGGGGGKVALGVGAVVGKGLFKGAKAVGKGIAKGAAVIKDEIHEAKTGDIAYAEYMEELAAVVPEGDSGSIVRGVETSLQVMQMSQFVGQKFERHNELFDLALDKARAGISALEATDVDEKKLGKLKDAVSKCIAEDVERAFQNIESATGYSMVLVDRARAGIADLEKAGFDEKKLGKLKDTVTKYIPVGVENTFQSMELMAAGVSKGGAGDFMVLVGRARAGIADLEKAGVDEKELGKLRARLGQCIAADIDTLFVKIAGGEGLSLSALLFGAKPEGFDENLAKIKTGVEELERSGFDKKKTAKYQAKIEKLEKKYAGKKGGLSLGGIKLPRF